VTARYRRIVVGTDGSATAAIAVEHAAALAAASGGELLIVTAFQPDRAPEVADDVPDDLRWTITDSAVAEEHVSKAAVTAAARGVASERIHVISEPGDPADALVSVAEARGADVIVVGSKGMHSASRFLLGSVPNKVSHHAPCDVLIVRTVG
jgi:nucleotide-binding universal stress UspA family protein